MASSAIYPPSPTVPPWQYSTGYPHDDRRPDYNTLYASSQPHPQYIQHQQAYQAWAPPPRFSVDTYQNVPYIQPPGLPSFVTSPPPLMHSLTDDPAFAPDPNTNPDNWFHRMDMLSTAPPPPRSYSASDLPQGFVPQSGLVPYPSRRAHSYHEDTTELSPGPQTFYFVTSSAASSSSDDSAASNSSATRPPRSSVRGLDYPRQHSDPSLHYIPATEAPRTLPDEGQSRPSRVKHRPRRRSAHAAAHAPVQTEVSGAVTPPVEQPVAHEDGTSHTVMSSVTMPPPSSLSERSERPNEGRRRTSSRPSPPDLDSIDELDETNPYGFNLHHRGPYEAIAAVLNETNPIDSPLLRAQGIQQQVSASAALRPSRRVQSVPSVNPMALNLRPGQILQSSIYQPIQPSHFPLDLSLAANPPRMPAEPPRVDSDPSITRSVRRSQTLSAPILAREPHEQSHHVPPPVRPEAQGYQRSYTTGSSTHLVEAQPPTPPEAPPTPDLDQSFSRTLYLTNPDERPDTPGHRLPAPPLPPAPESVDPSRKRRSKRSTQDHANGFYGGQPQVVAPGATTQTEVRRRNLLRNSHPVASTVHRQEPPRPYDPSSQSLAAMNALRAGHAESGSSTSSSRTSSSLKPRHIPKHLVMPTPLASTAGISPSTVRSEGSGPSAVSSRANGGRHGAVLRKRTVSGVMSRPQPARAPAPSETENRGVLAFLGFGKGSKPTVREVRVTEPTKRGMSEKQELRVRTREEPRKLSKRR